MGGVGELGFESFILACCAVTAAFLAFTVKRLLDERREEIAYLKDIAGEIAEARAAREAAEAARAAEAVKEHDNGTP